MAFVSAATSSSRQDLQHATLMSSSSPIQEESSIFEDNSVPPQAREVALGTGSSPRRYAFTPQRVKTRPRAWERRPATPYVPRNEAQKIWKRMPLGAVPANATASWRRDQQNTRPMKRLKVSGVDGEEDKENIEYIGMKWEEESEMAGSPKRKALGDRAASERPPATPEAHRLISGRPDGGATIEQHALAPVAADTECEIFSSHDDVQVGEATSPSVLDNVGQLGDGEDVLTFPTPTSTDASFSLAVPTTTTFSPSLTQETHDLPPKSHQEAGPSIAEAISTTSANPLADQDDTAYLHDFLSRARASKAAKHQPLLPGPTPQAMTQTETDDLTEGPTCSHIETVETASMPSADARDDATTLLANDEMEANLSPRRSSRLITRLPRPQKPITNLPSNISLKRLNGTEFIAMQRESQSVALATRTNTKRNKADSVPVNLRLIQLHAEAKVRQPEAETVVKETRKKRKFAKEVTWDQTLARTQEGSESSNAPEDEEECEEKHHPEERGAVGEVHNETEQDGAETVRKENENMEGRKVRKLRKLNVGTVNGTPAPKRSMRIPVPISSTSSSSSLKMAEMAKEGSALGAGAGVGEKRIQTRTQTRSSKGV